MTPEATNELIEAYEALVDVSGPMPGEAADWPSNIKEAIAEAVERLSAQLSRRVVVTKCTCEPDHDQPGRWFVRIQCMATLYLVSDRGWRH